MTNNWLLMINKKINFIDKFKLKLITIYYLKFIIKIFIIKKTLIKVSLE